MLVSAIVHPAVFSREGLEDGRYRQNLEDFFRGVWGNGTLLVDSDGRLLEQLVAASGTVGKRGRQVRILMEEIAKNTRSRVVRSLINPGAQDTEDLVYGLASIVKVDAVLTRTAPNCRPEMSIDTELISVPEYLDSRFASRRRSFAEDRKSLDKIDLRHCEELFGRCLRFAKWLRFYDAQLGMAQEPWRFREGLEYLLRLWLRVAYFPPQSVQIFTLHDRASFASRVSTLKRQVIDPLRGIFPFPIELIAKERGSMRDIHARFLETELIVLRVDRGFDLFDSHGRFLCNWISVEEQSRGDIKTWKNLPNSGPTIC